ncbi:hypothetical protein BDV95DRAFT_593633 [Massariosphaeria phaeospora]|uniref:Copper acquisition factor BIM1-like domain-containing protein n=1 Tax=Massariosphaeria phaeospora TaxID=100035 RepID=A0A7C8I8F7_9PLEO|nr:hypothetical protein BDV95DRAFT_593633 [Massariosphaeria phaeospora]
MRTALAFSTVLSLTSAHFTLDWPTARGFSDDTAGNFPCGGLDSVKTPRTSWPVSGAPVQLNMHHDQTRVAVYISIGEDPGSNYSVMLKPQLSMQGLGDFCVGSVSLPEGLNVTDGTPATIQVVTNGDPSGGLYQCADVTLTTKTLSEQDYGSHCKNRTGVKVVEENIAGNPNGTASGDSPSQSAAPSGTAAPPPSGGAVLPTAAPWLFGAVGLAGLALL